MTRPATSFEGPAPRAPFADAFVAALRAALPGVAGPVGLHDPHFSGNEWAYVKDCLDTGWVSYNGSYVSRFESMLVDLTGAGSCAAVSSGTVAIEMALRVIGVTAGDEVLSPSLTFVATNNAIAHLGAMPHFVDSESKSLGVDVAKLAGYLDDIAEMTDAGARNRLTGRRLAALLPMHCFGHPVDMDPLLELADRWKIPVVEDAAEAIGSTYKGRPCGSLAPIACLSFNGNKIITTGGGGAILTRDPELGKRLRHLTSTAKTPHAFEFIHDEIGWNYRLPNINAALGCAMLEQLPARLAAKRALQLRYEAAFAGMNHVSILREPSYAKSNYWLAAAILEDGDVAERDALLKAVQEAGFMCRAAWRLNHTLPMYQDCPRMPLETAEAIQPRLVNLPSAPQLLRTEPA
jgi:perosamine synthetase